MRNLESYDWLSQLCRVRAIVVEETILISFIIPAFNEEDSIGDTLSSINCGQFKLKYEVIVVDNDSTDKTVEVAIGLGANVVSAKGGTIGGVRNIGVSHSCGDLIIFLDADVSLTARWFGAFEKVVELLSVDPMVVTGSHCNAPTPGNWIERYWFNNLTHEVRVTHLGTGHMIVTRELFDIVNGFDEVLETGEDYSFCAQVRNVGGKIINNPELYVIHRDYPKNIWAFIKREAWHGMGDAGSVNAVLGSKVAVASLIFIILHLQILLVVLMSVKADIFMGLSLAGLAGLLFLSSWIKFDHCNFRIVLVNSVIFYFYFIGRCFSFIKTFYVKFFSLL